jgi:hypothetical protein
VTEVQEAEGQGVTLSTTDTVKSELPKFKPVTVMERPLVVAMLSTCRADSTAESNVKYATFVPATPPTVSSIRDSIELKIVGAHNSPVVEVHDTDMHESSKIALIVKSLEPKFRPDTVTEAAPLLGTFLSEAESTGASKVCIRALVPATA